MEAIGEAYAGIEAFGRIAIRPKLDVSAIIDRVEAILSKYRSTVACTGV